MMRDQVFRSEKLWQPGVELLYTQNETALRKLFEKFVALDAPDTENQNRSMVPLISLQSCQKLFGRANLPFIALDAP